MYEYLDKPELISFVLSENISKKERERLKEKYPKEKTVLALNRSTTQWYKPDKVEFLNEVVRLKNIACTCAGVRVKFPNCKVLFVDRCEKNFVYFYIRKRTFPNLEEVFLACSPCEPQIFYEGFKKIHLTKNYERYKERWAKNNDTVDVISEEQFKEELAKYKEEEAILG